MSDHPSPTAATCPAQAPQNRSDVVAFSPFPGLYVVVAESELKSEPPIPERLVWIQVAIIVVTLLIVWIVS